jgi:hypothetical protein
MIGGIAMVYRGHIKKGVVVLDNGAKLLDGTEVTVRPVTPRAAKRRAAKPKVSIKPTKGKEYSVPGVSAGLLRFAGAAKDLPPDAAINLDHYLYGHPKRK